MVSAAAREQHPRCATVAVETLSLAASETRSSAFPQRRIARPRRGGFVDRRDALTIVTLHLADIWIKDLTITTGLVDTYSTPTLIALVAGHKLDTSPMITHRSRGPSAEQPISTAAGRTLD